MNNILNQLIIRAEKTTDIEPINQLILLAFANHPHQDPNLGVTEHLIVQNLRQSAALTISLVAEYQAQIIAHVAFSPIQVNHQKSNYHVMAPVSVLPEFQNCGVGTQLIKNGLIKLQQFNSDGCVVLGDPEYYQRFGFHHNHKFSAKGAPKPYFMAQSFTDHHHLNNAAEITFHEAFTITN